LYYTHTGRVRAQREGQNISINFYYTTRRAESTTSFNLFQSLLSLFIIIILHIIYTAERVCEVGPSHYIKNTGCLRFERESQRSPVGQDASHTHHTTPTLSRALISTPRHMHRHKLWSSCDYVWRGQERRSRLNVDC
jgi:hypothetical protein